MSHYHAGELTVQERAGLRADAAHIEPAIGAMIPPVAAEFLAAQPMLAVSARDAAGRLWGTLLTGPPGFIRARDERRIHVDARPTIDDPLATALGGTHTRIGSIAIEPSRRRRMRVNGTAHPDGAGLLIEVDQVYANCPKHIQKRTPEQVRRPKPSPSKRGHALTRSQCQWLSTADTLFIATSDADGNCDMSHRGGNPGFVDVQSAKRLHLPDYVGNAMFMTLGNLATNPVAGLLVPDWSTGDLLHLTGTARVIWDPIQLARVPGAQRLVEFDIAGVLERAAASPLRWTTPEYSRSNPEVRSHPEAEEVSSP